MQHTNRGFVTAIAVALFITACTADDDPSAIETTPPATTPTSADEPSRTPTASEPTPTEAPSPTLPPFDPETASYDVPPGSRPHDVAPAVDGGVWYTAQNAGALGYLDPASGETRHIPLGAGSRPHGVIVGPDGDAWITDSGLNAIVRVDAESEEVEVFPLPSDRPDANLNTAAFGGDDRLWFTGQNGVYGRFNPASGEMAVFDAPHGRGPYGITATPDGEIYFASLAGSYVGHIDQASDEVTVLEPPTSGQGARRVWSDSMGRIWISEWDAGQLGRYDPATEQWQEWPLPGDDPMAYAVYVDERDAVWVSDFGGDAIWRFDPVSEEFGEFPSSGQVRQMLGRDGELWAPVSATDTLVVIRY